MTKDIENVRLRQYSGLRWDEPVLMEMSVPGERGVFVPEAEDEIVAEVGDGVSCLGSLQRKTPLNIPEVAQSRLIQHYAHLSEENMGSYNSLTISEGTCTTKYNPVVQEHLASQNPNCTEIHPLQSEETMQGTLQIMYEMQEILKAISGLDKFCFQPGGGAHAVNANAAVIRKYHESRGDFGRNEIITTIHTHPSSPGTTAMQGFKVITLSVGPDGLPEIEAFKAALSEHTAAFFVTNPEDTGLYNGRMKQFTDAAHAAGALCSYDQANGNAVLGIARAKEAGFDTCHFNLHKTFSAPHGSFGPGCGAQGVTEELAPFLPTPTVEFDGEKYWLDYDRPQSIGKARSFYGNFQAVLKAWMWCRTLGPDGLREASVIAVLNNQYLTKKILENVRGSSLPWDVGQRRMEQTRFSLETLVQETGCQVYDLNNRLADYGLIQIWQAHHPFTFEDPFTPEPVESYSKEDIDYFCKVLATVAEECYSDPEMVKTAPHHASKAQLIDVYLEDYANVASTWRMYLKKFAGK